MDNSKLFLKENNIMPTISFKTQAVHTFKLLNDKLEKMKTDDGEKQGVRYLIEEDGEKKTFFTGSPGLIQKLADFNPGDVLTVEMKSIKGQNGFISVYEVSPVGRQVAPEAQNAPVSPEKAPEIDIPQVEDKYPPEDEIRISDIPF